MLPAGVPGVVAGPTTNLSIGMDYWVAPTTAIPPEHGKVLAAAATGAMVSGPLVGASEKVPSEIWLQAEYEELAQRVEALRDENAVLQAEVERIKKEYDALLALNATLKHGPFGILVLTHLLSVKPSSRYNAGISAHYLEQDQ
ncbi:hypothetical protein BHE74_00046150, partial [Ensete ventricosum]